MPVYAFEELTWGKLRRLGQSGALFLLPLGPLEDHGSHLPSGVDWYLTRGFTEDMAARLGESCDVVVVPALAVGSSLLSNLGCVRVSTAALRRSVIEMGRALAREAGVRRLAVLSTHGAISQARALSSACSALSRPGDMRAIAPCQGLIQRFLGGAFRARIEELLGRPFSQDEWRVLRFDVHAGAWETALMLKYRPDLVGSFYTELPAHVPDKIGLGVLRKLRTHRGYFGAPALASRELGEALATVLADEGARALATFMSLELPARRRRVGAGRRRPGHTAVVAVGLGLALAVTAVWAYRKKP